MHGKEAYGGAELHVQSFLMSKLDGGERLASRPGRFVSGEAVLVRWMKHSAVIDAKQFSDEGMLQPI